MVNSTQIKININMRKTKPKIEKGSENGRKGQFRCRQANSSKFMRKK